MAKMVLHLSKIKRSGITAIQHHVYRENHTYSNGTIDLTRIEDNVILYGNYSNSHTMMQKIDHDIVTKASHAKIRKDSVYMVDGIVSAGKDMFTMMSREQQIQFFKDMVDTLKKETIGNNLVYAVIHMDETTPHMHIGYTPITADGRLCVRDYMSRDTLRRLQDKIPEAMAAKGYNIQRGTNGSKIQHLTVAEYKADAERQKNELQAENIKIQNKIDKLMEDNKDLTDKVRWLLQAYKDLQAGNVDLANKIMQQVQYSRSR